MKKLVSLLLALLMLMGIMAVPSMAAGKDVSVYLFGEELSFDVPAQIINGRTMVPLRAIFEKLGASVEWDKETKTAISVREDKTISVTVNDYTMFVNGNGVALDVAPCIVNDRTLVPLRAVSEAFDLNVEWISSEKIVVISKPVDVNKELDDIVLAKLGDYEITQADYNCNYYIIASAYGAYKQYFGNNWINMDIGTGETVGETIKSETKFQIESLLVAAEQAKRVYGITAEDVKDNVNLLMLEMVSAYSGQEYELFFKDVQTSEKALRKYFEMYEIFGLLTEKMAQDSNYVKDADVEEMFDMEYGDKIKVQHILISTSSLGGITPPKTDAVAVAIVNEVLEKLKNGEDFGTLIDLYNEDPGMTSEDYYVFGDGEMVPEFETASKNLAIGEYTTQAVKSDYGYHIIKRFSLDKTSEEFQYYKMYFAQELLYDMIEAEVGKASISWDDDTINEHIDSRYL